MKHFVCLQVWAMRQEIVFKTNVLQTQKLAQRTKKVHLRYLQSIVYV